MAGIQVPIRHRGQLDDLFNEIKEIDQQRSKVAEQLSNLCRQEVAKQLAGEAMIAGAKHDLRDIFMTLKRRNPFLVEGED